MFTFSAPNADMLLPIISKSHTVNSSLQLKNKTHLVCRQYSAHLFCIPSFRMILQLYVHRGQRYHQAGLQCASVFFQQCSNHTQEIAVSEPKEKKTSYSWLPAAFLVFFFFVRFIACSISPVWRMQKFVEAYLRCHIHLMEHSLHHMKKTVKTCLLPMAGHTERNV